MAKIDITKIEGYADMTAEEKLAALESLELPEQDFTGWVKKDVADRYASEAAEFKRKLRQQMSEDEAAKAAALEEQEQMRKELEALKREKYISENTAKFLEIGYDGKMAAETAEALLDGKMEVLFQNHAKHIANRERALKAELLKGTEKPPAGEGGHEMTKEQFRALSLMEKQRMASEQPDVYKAMTE